MVYKLGSRICHIKFNGWTFNTTAGLIPSGSRPDATTYAPCLGINSNGSRWNGYIYITPAGTIGGAYFVNNGSEGTFTSAFMIIGSITYTI